MALSIRAVISGFLLFFAQSGWCQSEAALQFSLSLDSNSVHVSLHVTPPESDSTVFQYGNPGFGGQMDIFSGLINVVVSKSGQLKINSKNRTLTVLHNGFQPFDISYDIIDTHTPKQGNSGELFRPLISKDYLYAHGLNIFLCPLPRDDKKLLMQSVSWKSKPHLPWFFGFDPESSSNHITTASYESFLMAPITAAIDLTVEKISIDGISNYLVLRKNGISSKDHALILNYFKNYNQSLRRFWNDYSGKEFSLVLQPYIGVKNAINGIAFDKGFIGKYSADTLVSPRMIFILSHEIDHHWIGQKLAIGKNGQWFGEGFNDYIASFVLLNAGLINVQEFENNFNTTFKNHYTSPARNLRNDSVSLMYWKSSVYKTLPYNRGNIFAFYIDNLITVETNGAKNIRDLLLDLLALQKVKPAGTELTVEDFIFCASVYVSKEKLVEAMKKYIDEGHPVDFSTTLLMPGIIIKVMNGIPVLKVIGNNAFSKHFRYK